MKSKKDNQFEHHRIYIMYNIHRILLAAILLIGFLFVSCKDSGTGADEQLGDDAEEQDKPTTFVNYYPIYTEDLSLEYLSGSGRSTDFALTTDANGNITMFGNYRYQLTVDTYGDSVLAEWGDSDFEEELSQLLITSDDPEYHTDTFTTKYADPSPIEDCQLKQEDQDYLMQQTLQERAAGIENNLWYEDIAVNCVENDMGYQFDILTPTIYTFYDELYDTYYKTNDLWVRMRNNQGKVIASHVFWGDPYDQQDEPLIAFLYNLGGRYDGEYGMVRLRDGGLFIARNRRDEVELDYCFCTDFDTKWIYIDGNGNIIWDKWINETPGELQFQLLSGAAELSDGRLIAGYYSYERGETNAYFEHFYIIDPNTGNTDKFTTGDLHPQFPEMQNSERYIEFVSEHPDGSILILVHIDTSESELSGLDPGFYLLKLDPNDLSYETSNIGF